MTICTVSWKEVLDKVGWAFSPTMKLCWGRSPNLQKAISYASQTATRHVKGDLVPAFTLAEVLITLGIIGVVAAMTLPTLIQNYKRKEASTRLKKGYSVISQAITRSIADNGDIQYWDKTGEQFSEDGSSDTVANGELSYNFFMKYLAPYIKYTKIDKAVVVEIPEDAYKYELKVNLADGSTLYMHNGDCIDLRLDINGDNNHNQYVYDIFAFVICTVNSQRNIFCHNKSWFCTYSSKDNITRAQSLEACKSSGFYCSRLLEIDNWEFKDDYPYKL